MIELPEKYLVFKDENSKCEVLTRIIREIKIKFILKKYNNELPEFHKNPYSFDIFFDGYSLDFDSNMGIEQFLDTITEELKTRLIEEIQELFEHSIKII